MSFGATIQSESGPCSVADTDCEFRSCLWVRQDPGTYVQGRGYRYEGPAKRRLLCGNREARGCPTPTPDPDPERARCCRAAPDLPVARGAPSHQTCRTCGTRLRGRRLELARTLTALPSVRCAHAHARQLESLPGDPPDWWCHPLDYDAATGKSHRGCGGHWDAKPAPYVPGEGVHAFAARRRAAFMARLTQDSSYSPVPVITRQPEDSENRCDKP